MQEVLALSLASMQQDKARLDQVALNLANVTTPGYKRQVVVARPFAETLHDVQANQRLSLMTDSRAGTIKHTGQPLDVALTGEGFFEVITDKGPAYTRAGNFGVDSRGRLVSAQGYQVMGKNGDIQLIGRSPLIDKAGHITEAASAGGSASAIPVGQLKVVRFENTHSLERLGDGLVAAGEGMTVLDSADVSIRQGATENANVNPTHEMVELIQAMRHFETMHRVVQGYDEMIGTAVRKLAEG
jgi:flagellar basal-body rod protein FlgF